MRTADRPSAYRAALSAVDLSVLRFVSSHYRLRLVPRVWLCQLPPSAKPRSAPRAAPLPWLAALLLSHVTVLQSERRADGTSALSLSLPSQRWAGGPWRSPG